MIRSDIKKGIHTISGHTALALQPTGSISNQDLKREEIIITSIISKIKIVSC